ncbi:hypothetical protein TNCV_1481181 [Trichonephila clavipes]|nr:hypothetical protein TNCV_1481181 [Trichonephila clavipes]
MQYYIATLGWERLHHPQYSLGLAPSDFHLFPALKKNLAKKRFGSNSEVKQVEGPSALRHLSYRLISYNMFPMKNFRASLTEEAYNGYGQTTKHQVNAQDIIHHWVEVDRDQADGVGKNGLGFSSVLLIDDNTKPQSSTTM